MQLHMKQKVWSFTDRFTIKDNNGADRWNVAGEVFSLGKRLHVYDAAGAERALLRQKLFSFLPCYHIETDGVHIADVVKDFTFFRQQYTVHGRPWVLEGDFWAHEYQLLENGIPIMRMSKEWFTWGDSYLLDIDDRADELCCLCVALAVDCALDSQKNN